MAAHGKNMAVKAILALCMLMQGASVFPHHHHGHNETPCLFFLHCLQTNHATCAHHEEPAAEGHDCGGHRHDCPSEACSPERDIVAGLRIDRAGDTQQSSPVWIVYRPASLSGTSHIALADTESARRRDKERPFVERPYLVYVTRASLLRAPTPMV